MLRRSAIRESGFTLIEMIVTMGIFAVLAALTVPTMRVWIANNKVRTTADALQNGLRLAQSEALRRSRQLIFSLTNSNTPTGTFAAVAGGNYWAIDTVPSMTDGSDTNPYVDSGVLPSVGTAVTMTGPAAICFNSMGRLVANSLVGVTGQVGVACTLPSTAIPPSTASVWAYTISATGSDRPLRVTVSLGGQVHMCDPSKALSAINPDGC